MCPSIAELRSALTNFSNSANTFRVLLSIPSQQSSSSSSSSQTAIAIPPPKTLYILDSSFNPPTRAHLKIASSALRRDRRGAEPKRLILLLATQNADKAPKPAPLEHRLMLMSRFAHDLLQRTNTQLSSSSSSSTTSPPPTTTIDIALTKYPYFNDKADAIASSSFYGGGGRGPPEQVHLVGFDTLIRILNPRYYPPDYTLAPLTSLLASHRLRVAYRPGGGWGGRLEQDRYLADLRDGKREAEGGRREWAERIELVGEEDMNDDEEEEDGDGEEEVSSTRAREAARNKDEDLLSKMVTDGVWEWVKREKLYIEDT